MKRFCDQVGTTIKILETGKVWGNRYELYIGLLKEAVHKDLRASNAHMVLWYYAIQWRSSIRNAVPFPFFQSYGQTPHVSTFGVQGDISNLCTVGWYEWVYYCDVGTFTENKVKLRLKSQ